MKGQKIRNSIVYLLPMIVGNVLPFLTLPIMTRILLPEDYGALALAQAYAATMVVLLNLSLPLGYERNAFECEGSAEKSGLLYSIQALVFGLVVLGGLLTVFFGEKVSLWLIGSPAHGTLFIVCYITAGFSSLKAYHLTYLRNEERAGAYARWNILETLTSAVISVVLVVVLRIGVMGLALGQLLAVGGTYVLLFLVTARALPVFLDRRQLWRAFKVSYPMTAGTVFKAFWNQVDKYLVSLLNNVGGVGIYSLGQRFGTAVFNIMSAMDNVMMPQLYKLLLSKRPQDTSEVGKVVTPYAYISLFLALLAVEFCEEVITLMLPEIYYSAIYVTIIFSLHYGSSFIGKVTGVQLLYCKKSHVSLILNMTNIISLSVFSFLLTTPFGAIGTAVAFFISGVIYKAAGFLMAQRYYKIQFEYGKMALIHAVFLLTAVSVLALRALDCPYGFRLGSKLAQLVFYVWCGMRIGVLSRESLAGFTAAVAGLVVPEQGAAAPASSGPAGPGEA